MKSRLLFVALLVLGVWLHRVVIIALADQPARHPLQKELVGPWAGYDEGCLGFYRFVLNEGGIGSCTVLFREELAGAYHVKWHAQEGKLVLTCTPTNRDSQHMAITVTYVDLVRIEAVVKHTAGSWERKACFYNEREFLNRLRKASLQAETLPEGKSFEGRGATRGVSTSARLPEQGSTNNYSAGEPTVRREPTHERPW